MTTPNPTPKGHYSQVYYKKYPWKRTYAGICQRTDNPKSPGYKYYGGRGIKNFLTINDLKYLWNRDKSDKMKRPSIDRIDPDGNYTLKNCRYIEFNENSRKRYKTHCKNGHEFNAENTRVVLRPETKRIERSCIPCHKVQAKNWEDKNVRVR